MQQSLFRTQVDPHVVVYATPDKTRPSVIVLVIENVGKRVAKNVRFTLSEPLPGDAWGLGDDVPEPEQMRSGPLITR